MRLFIACRIPTPAQQAIAGVSNSVRHSLPAASWVRDGSLHLTFAFLGEQNSEAVPPLASALATRLNGTPAVSANLGGIGFFPSSGRPRVGWLAVEPAQLLVGIAATVRGAAQDCGLSIDEKPFVPHLTIVRMKATWKQQDRSDLARAFKEIAIPAASLDSVHLIRSNLRPEGPSYENLASIVLVKNGGRSVDERDSSAR